MTSERQRKRGYLTPETAEGHDLMMVCLCIPDEPFYRAAFRGALYELTKWWNWSAHSPDDYQMQYDSASLWLETLEATLNMPCNICDLFAECLENMQPGDALYDALRDWLAGAMQNDETIREIIENGSTGTGAHPGANTGLISECDNDLLFGFSLQLVQWMNRRIVDVFELLETATNFIEFLSAVTNLIPILSQALDYVEFLQDVGMDNYLAGYNQTLENQYACDIWCYAKNHGCKITWKELTEYFLNKLFIDLADNDVFDILSVLASGVWNGDEFVHVMMATFCAVIHFGGEWELWSLGDIQNVVESMWNDPNPDWAVLCDPCASTPWTVRYDFGVEDPKGWTVDVGRWFSNRVASLAEGQPGGHYIELHRDFDPFDGLEQFQYPNIVIDFSGQSSPHLHVIVTHSEGTLEQFDFPYEGAGAANCYFDPPLQQVTYIRCEAREDYAGDGGQVSINGIVLVGESDNPPPDPE